MGLTAEKIGDYLFKGGLLLAALSLVFFFLIFHPIIRSELRFLLSEREKEAKIVLEDKENGIDKKNNKNVIIPADENFSIVIPKIKANEKIIANVNPFNQGEYLRALKDGIAHAKNSGFPGQKSNVFLFAHSSGNFYQNSRLNTVFFLLNKLENGDRFSIIYQGEIYEYEVFNKKIVAEDEVAYLENGKEEIATLMTCWPPGTAYKRLLVAGKIVK